MTDERMSWSEFRQQRMAEAGASQAYDAAKTDDGASTVDVPCATCGKPVTITPTENVGSWQCGHCAKLPWPRQLPTTRDHERALAARKLLATTDIGEALGTPASYVDAFLVTEAAASVRLDGETVAIEGRVDTEREDWAAYAAAARSDADKVEQCGVRPSTCHHCALHSLANAYEIAADIETERDRLAAELTRWESGQRRLAMPVVQSVPDGLRYAADLVRAAHEVDDYRLAELMRGAGMRLRTLHNAAGQLLAEAVVMRAELEEVAGDG